MLGQQCLSLEVDLWPHPSPGSPEVLQSPKPGLPRLTWPSCLRFSPPTPPPICESQSKRVLGTGRTEPPSQPHPGTLRPGPCGPTPHSGGGGGRELACGLGFLECAGETKSVSPRQGLVLGRAGCRSAGSSRGLRVSQWGKRATGRAGMPATQPCQGHAMGVGGSQGARTQEGGREGRQARQAVSLSEARRERKGGQKMQKGARTKGAAGQRRSGVGQEPTALAWELWGPQAAWEWEREVSG